MTPRPSVSTHTSTELDTFEVVSTPAGAHADPSGVDFAGAMSARAPCTLAKALSDAKQLDWASPPDFDGRDHWYRAALPELGEGARHELVFEGLATIADVWIDGELVLHSENMFVCERRELPAGAHAGSELVLCFRALKPRLAARRPRPRWRTRIVEAQQLRYVRTALLGRTPGFCPALPVVGPYRPVRLDVQRHLTLESCSLVPALLADGATLEVHVRMRALGGFRPQNATFTLRGPAGHGGVELPVQEEDGVLVLRGAMSVSEVTRWWPHTHGPQPLSHARLTFADSTIDIELGLVGFRSVEVDREADGLGFGLRINGVPVFCRGACWTTDDLLTLGATRLRETLSLVRDAGMNMLRIPGITSYESASFHTLCDELGIMVFQDFMFANMDYPIDDAAFAGEVTREARGLLGRIGHSPSLTVLCGGSEVEQQAAMLGLPAEQWTSPLFSELLPRLCEELAAGVPYVPSSPSGGTLPFQVSAGVSHYYGVGAYGRPLEDARRSRVRFTSECLAFANTPVDATIEAFMGDLEMPFHHPRWKQRVPRDRGASWDFEDVRDHYVERLFGQNPRELRHGDPERYLKLGCAAVGEAMLATFAEWRSEQSSCRGGLVFWLKDYWPGAGWGVIDALGVPKSAYYYLARAMQPVSLACTDEGLNGLLLHASNDGPEALDAELTLRLYKAGEALVAERTSVLTLAPHAVHAVSAEALLGRFSDSSYAYRFGPANHDLVHARLRTSAAHTSDVFFFPTGYARAQELDIGLEATPEERDGRPGVRVTTRRFAQCVTLDVPGFRPRDDWFHLEPRGERFVELVPERAGQTVRGSVAALNALTRAAIK